MRQLFALRRNALIEYKLLSSSTFVLFFRRFCSSLFIVSVAEDPAPPMQEITIGKKLFFKLQTFFVDILGFYCLVIFVRFLGYFSFDWPKCKAIYRWGKICQILNPQTVRFDVKPIVVISPSILVVKVLFFK